MDRWLLFVIFFSIVLSIFALMQWRVIRAYRSWVHAAFGEEKRNFWLRGGLTALIVLNLIFFLRFFIDRIGRYDDPLLQSLLIYPGGIFFAALTLTFLLLLIRDLFMALRWIFVKVITRMKSEKSPKEQTFLHNESRRRFLRMTGFATAASVTTLPILSSLATARDYEINTIPLEYGTLPSGLDGLSVVQISDIHSGVFMLENNMREIFEIANGLDPDIVIITGDFVDNSDSQIEPLYKALGSLKSRYGIYGCLGNHDHIATVKKVNSALVQRSIKMLNNSHVSIPIAGEQLSIVGIDDAGGGGRDFSNLTKALEGCEPHAFKILLSHRPHIFDQSKLLNIDLTLSGHTHGGQVGLETGWLNLNPVYLVHKYAKGLYSDGSKQLYVNVGVGMVGVPIRLVRPEIARFTLHKSQPYA